MTVRSVRVSTEPGVQAGHSDIFPAAAGGVVRAVARCTPSVVIAAATTAIVGGCGPRKLPPAGIPAAASAPQAAAPQPLPPPPPSRWRIASPSSVADYVIESRAIVAARG